jgi:hypothetical protein
MPGKVPGFPPITSDSALSGSGHLRRSLQSWPTLPVLRQIQVEGFPDVPLEQSPDSALTTQRKELPVNCVTGSVAYVNERRLSQRTSFYHFQAGRKVSCVAF